jgi:hypothetical protein
MTARKLNRITALLLVLGLGAALAILLTAEPEREDPLLNGPWAQKKYQHELKVIGGRANVVAADFQEWFDGLWHGRALAGTVAVLTVATVLTFRFVATFPSADLPPPSAPGSGAA